MIDTPIIITCSTQNQPAPYAYSQRFVLNKVGNSLSVELKMKYLDRDTLTAEEIYEEGFTEEDDYEWKVALSETWIQELERVIERTSYRKKPGKEEPLAIEIEGSNSKDQPAQFPSEYDMWEYFTQELAQAVFEVSGRELPLQIQIKEITKAESSDFTIQGSFAERSAKVTRNGEEIAIPWQKLKSMIKTVFMPDYLPELAMEKEPRKRGLFFSMEEGIWYKVGHAILEPSKKSKTLERLEELVSELSEL